MTSCADQCHAAGSHRKNARVRIPAPAALTTRPIGRPSTAVDAEGRGLGVVLLISRGRPLLTQNGSGWPIGIVITDARCYERRSGSLADTAADRRRPPVLVRISIRRRSADWHKHKRTSEGTDKPSLWKGKSPTMGAYMISPAYRSARNDKFCLYSTLVLLRMIFIFTDRPWGLSSRYASSRV